LFMCYRVEGKFKKVKCRTVKGQEYEGQVRDSFLLPDQADGPQSLFQSLESHNSSPSTRTSRGQSLAFAHPKHGKAFLSPANTCTSSPKTAAWVDMCYNSPMPM
jgi:hypothetical protein